MTLLLAGAALALPGDVAPVAAQQSGEAAAPEVAPGEVLPDGIHVRVGVRPRALRVGEAFELTVQLRGPAERSVEIEELVGDAFEVVDVQERRSVAVGTGGRQDLVREVVFTGRAEVSGDVVLGPLRVFVDDAPYLQPAPTIRVQPEGIAWNRGVRRSQQLPEAPVLPDGRPAALGGEDTDLPGGRPGPGIVATIPGGVRPVQGGFLANRFGFGGVPGVGPGFIPPAAVGGAWGGGLPFPGNVMTGSVGAGDGFDAGVVGGWAEIATADPNWEEMIPRIGGWESEVRDATGTIRFRAGVGPRPVYVGQQLTYLATAAFTPEAGFRLAADPEFRPPSPRDVWRVDVPRLGLGYLGGTEGDLEDVRPFVQAFFPLRSGTIEIPPAELLYSMGAGGRLGPLDTLRTAPIAVEVLPIPTGNAPDGWDGAVGRYRVDVSLDREILAPGEAALLTLVVRGAGNVEGLPSPRPVNLRGVLLRPAGEQAVVEVRDGVVGGVKVFRWFVTLGEPGRAILGPFLFPYFDPWAGVFEIAATPELLLDGIG